MTLAHAGAAVPVVCFKDQTALVPLLRFGVRRRSTSRKRRSMAAPRSSCARMLEPCACTTGARLRHLRHGGTCLIRHRRHYRLATAAMQCADATARSAMRLSREAAAVSPIRRMELVLNAASTTTVGPKPPSSTSARRTLTPLGTGSGAARRANLMGAVQRAPSMERAPQSVSRPRTKSSSRTLDAIRAVVRSPAWLTRCTSRSTTQTPAFDVA